jgi:hypothetical protein
MKTYQTKAMDYYGAEMAFSDKTSACCICQEFLVEKI